MSSEEAPRAATDPQIDTPSLNIFLGSTPSYAALEAMRRLVYLPESDRRKVALVYLDIDSPPSEVLQFRQEHLGQLHEFDLRISVAHGVRYADQLPADIAQHTYIATKIPESFDNGAGGIRNNGHVAACVDHDRIVQTIDQALAGIGALPTDRGARPVSEVAVNIVAFLGGGTGSGILADLAVMARHRILQLNLKHRLNIFCLLPEHVREATTNDVSWRKSNATATVMELLALSMSPARADGHALPYTHYMLSTPYELRGETIANEVFLFGRFDDLRRGRRAHRRPRPVYAYHQRFGRRLPRTLEGRRSPHAWQLRQQRTPHHVWHQLPAGGRIPCCRDGHRLCPPDRRKGAAPAGARPRRRLPPAQRQRSG
jgi:hypothetical protein